MGDLAGHPFFISQGGRVSRLPFPDYPRGSRFVTTFQHLLLQPNLLSHPLNQLRQLHLNLLPRFGIHIMLHALAAHVRRREAAPVEVIVDLVNAPAAGF